MSSQYDSRPLYITGGQGGPGGKGHLHGTGGPGGAGLGPTVHITAQQLIAQNLNATLTSEQAFQLSNIQASQLVNHCPPLSRIFHGRRSILDKMHDFFFSNTAIQHIYVLHGLGGAGKTQIALKFINEVSSHTIATIDAGLKNIAAIKDSGNSREDGLLLLTSKVEEWLIFFDNADDPSIDLNNFIPPSNHGNIIITSRNPGLRVHAGSHSHVSDMEEEDAVALLLRSATQEVTLDTQKIATEIVKAGAFILKSQDLEGYLTLYTKNNQAQLLSEKPSQSHDPYPRTVYTTWQMSFDRLEPLAAMLLQHCSFLHHNGISEKIFSYASKYIFQSSGPSKEELREPLEFLSHFLGPAGEWDSLKFWHVINEIQAYSLVNFEAEKKLFSIHPLVHAWSQTTVYNPEKYMFTMGSTLGMAVSERPRHDIQLSSLVLCPHVELSIQMDAEVVLVFRHRYALIFLEGGKYKQTEKLMQEVLEKQKQLLGNNHLDTLHTMGSLANIYSHLGEHQKAKELQVIVLEKQSQLLGENHLDTLCTMRNVANTYGALGELQKAQELGVIVLEKQKQVLGDNHPETLLTMSSLANRYSDLGEHQKAKELDVIVLEKQNQLLGDNHLDTLCTMGDLANRYSHLREYQKAIELNVIVLKKQKQLIGDNHSETLRTLGNLASAYSELGEYQKAEELNVIVLEKQKQILGHNHPHTLITMGNLAEIYSDLGEHQRAKELSVFVLEKRKKLLGDNHPHTLYIMSNLAKIYSDLGEHQRAKELSLIVLEKQKRLQGENHPHTQLTMGTLAKTYSHLGEHEKAKEIMAILLEQQKQVLGDNHLGPLHTMDNVALEERRFRNCDNVALEERRFRNCCCWPSWWPCSG